MAIKQLPSGKWKVTLSLPGSRKQKSRTFQAKADAEDFERAAKRQLDAGGQISEPFRDLTLRQVVKRYKLHPDWQTLRPSTRKSVESKLKQLHEKFKINGRYVADWPVSQLDRAELTRFFTSLTEQGFSANTVRLYRALIQRLFRFASDELSVPLDLAMFRKIELPECVAKGAELAPNVEAEFLKFIHEHGDKELARFIALALATGARAGELCTLHRNDVRFPAEARIPDGTAYGQLRAFITFKGANTKTKRSRTIALTVRESQILREQLNDVQKRDTELAEFFYQQGLEYTPCPFVFASKRKRMLGDWIPYVYGSKWRKAKKWWEKEREGDPLSELDPRYLRFHDMRHTSITRLVRANETKTDAQLMEVTGHTTHTTFVRYFRGNTQKDLSEMADTRENKFKNPETPPLPPILEAAKKQEKKNLPELKRFQP